MEADLLLTDKQYLITLTVFYFPYALFELPSNILLRSLKPSRWLPFLILCYGTVTTMQGVVKNYGQLVGEYMGKCFHFFYDRHITAVRFLLGFVDSGLHSGILFYLTWCVYDSSYMFIH